MTRETGNYGEELARKFLKKSGYKIIGQNLNSKLGEIDILAIAPSNYSMRTRKTFFPLKRGFMSTIVVVEVKTKSTKEFGEGFEMVNYYKRQKLLLLAKSLHTKYPKNVIRIDIISVDLSGENPKIDHFESAVEE